MSVIDRIWSLVAPIAELHCDSLCGRVDIRQPQLGVHRLVIDRQNVDGALLALSAADYESPTNSATNEWPAEVGDNYARDNDLVAAYRATERWPFAPQIYWSGPVANSIDAELRPPCSLSLLVSVQTDLLDTHPKICVTTRLPAVEVVELRHAAEKEAQAMLWRLAEHDWSYLEYVPRSDYSEMAIDGEAAGHMTCEWRLFGEFLEKGVIRRARVSAAFLPREGDEQAAAEWCRQFARMPPPLTT
jgi:hypothetical protein